MKKQISFLGMVRKGFLCVLSILTVSFLCLLAACAGAEEFKLSSAPETAYSYEWSKSVVNDTVFLTCEQSLSFMTEDKEQHYAPTAVVKLFAVKDTVYFAANQDPQPVFEQKTGSSAVSGNYPEKVLSTHQFTFEDGQTIMAVVSVERFYYTIEGKKIMLPYMDVSDVNFMSAEIAEVDNEPNVWDALTSFKVEWQVNGKTDKGFETAEVRYAKKQTSQSDVLLNTEYTKGYDWVGDNTFVLFVEEINTWSLSGVKRQKYSSPDFVFDFVGQTDKTLTVKNFSFTGKLNSNQARKENISSAGWNLKKGMVTNTLAFTNGDEAFDDVFTYPAFEASYTVGGKTFNFDLSIEFDEAYRLEKQSSDKAVNTTTATAKILERVFTQNVTTTLNLESSSEPDDPDDTDPIPGRQYGEILDFSVTAVFNVDGINSGQVTEKCVCIRYEEGYEWGVCAYDAAFPTEMTYVQSGYTGFNSAAKSGEGQPYRIARADDVSQGIKWYAEDNTLLSAIDELTCKIYGWQNVQGGQYSSVVSGYDGTYASNRYQLTITAPNGAVKVIKSSPLP